MQAPTLQQNRPHGGIFLLTITTGEPFLSNTLFIDGLSVVKRKRKLCWTHPDSCLGEVGPHRDLLSGAHVRVAVPLERGFQLLELLAGKMSPLPPLFLLQRTVLSARLIQLVLVGFLCVCHHTGGEKG